jgi:hypothetical protein
MWNFLNCYLSGRHDYGMRCEPGAIFLRCIHCGRRSSGWALDQKEQAPLAHLTVAKAPPPTRATVIPFSRAAAS